MAERRMFAKTIIDSDQFLELPASTQLLYFHLSMRADDDGFINKPKFIMRMCGAGKEDLKKLIDNQYLIAFDSGMALIRHWKINNYIRPDRYKPTIFPEKELVQTDQRNIYCLKPEKSPAETIPPLHDLAEKPFPTDDGLPGDNCPSHNGIPMVYQMDTQVSVGKVRSDQVSTGKFSSGVCVSGSSEQTSGSFARDDSPDTHTGIINGSDGSSSLHGTKSRSCPTTGESDCHKREISTGNGMDKPAENSSRFTSPDTHTGIINGSDGSSSLHGKKPASSESGTVHSSDNLLIPCKNGSFSISSDYFRDLCRRFPAMEVEASLQKLRCYLTSHPVKQVFLSGIRGYIEMWLHDDARCNRYPKQPKNTEIVYDLEEYESYSVVDDWKEDAPSQETSGQEGGEAAEHRDVCPEEVVDLYSESDLEDYENYSVTDNWDFNEE